MTVEERYKAISASALSTEQKAEQLKELLATLPAHERAQLRRLMETRMKQLELEAFLNYQKLSPDQRREVDRILDMN